KAEQQRPDKAAVLLNRFGANFDAVIDQKRFQSIVDERRQRRREVLYLFRLGLFDFGRDRARVAVVCRSGVLFASWFRCVAAGLAACFAVCFLGGVFLLWRRIDHWLDELPRDRLSLAEDRFDVVLRYLFLEERVRNFDLGFLGREEIADEQI